MVQGVVEHHAGAVAIDSEPGKGSRVSVWLPTVDTVNGDRSPKRQEASVSEAVEPRSVPGTVILVVDDEPQIRSMVQRILGAEGHSVLTADNGAEAVSVVRDSADSLGLVILDQTMPVMDGIDAFREISALAPDLPVLFATGNLTGEEAEVLVELGIVSLLNKPYGPEELREAVAEALADAAGAVVS